MIMKIHFLQTYFWGGTDKNGDSCQQGVCTNKKMVVFFDHMGNIRRTMGYSIVATIVSIKK